MQADGVAVGGIVAMFLMNSKNCVACTIEYGIGAAVISASWAIFARK